MGWAKVSDIEPLHLIGTRLEMFLFAIERQQYRLDRRSCWRQAVTRTGMGWVIISDIEAITFDRNKIGIVPFVQLSASSFF